MKLIITGGLGYIGSITVQEAITRGHEVIVVDKGWFADESVDKIREQCDVRILDILEDFNLLVKGTKPDGVIHLAGLSNDPQAEAFQKENFLINAEGTRIVGLACMENNVPMTFGSSASVYGFVDNETCTEESNLNPKSHYANAKVKAENHLLALSRDSCYKFRPWIFRQATCMGITPVGRFRADLVVNTMCMNAWYNGDIHLFGGGESWRPLVHILDVAKAHLHVLENKYDDIVDSRIYNLAHKNYRISELGNYITYLMKQFYDKNIKVIPHYPANEYRSYSLSTQKLEKEVGFKAEIGIQQTVKEICDFFKNNPNFNPGDNIHRNINWMRCLLKAEEILKITGGIF